MDGATLAYSPFVLLLCWSVALLVVHIMLQGQLATRELGTKWNAGPRDGDTKPKGVLAGRAERASANFRETYPAFVALAAAAGLMGITSGWALIGAYLWFACRIVYIPLYLAGVPYVRSLVWLGSLVGLLTMFIAIVFA